MAQSLKPSTPPSNIPTDTNLPTESRDIYAGIASAPFSEQQARILTQPIDGQHLDVHPITGAVYLSQVHYRRILNRAFAPGGWALMPTGQAIVKGNTAIRHYVLMVNGRFVAEAYGEADNVPNNPQMTWATTLEAVKSNALMRCCKDLGIASECWDREYATKWREENCIKVHIANSKRPQWRKKTAPAFPNETGIVGLDPAIHQQPQRASETNGEWIIMDSKKKGKCACGKVLALGERIAWHKAEKRVLCMECFNAPIPSEESSDDIAPF